MSKRHEMLKHAISRSPIGAAQKGAVLAARFRTGKIIAADCQGAVVIELHDIYERFGRRGWTPHPRHAAWLSSVPVAVREPGRDGERCASAPVRANAS